MIKPSFFSPFAMLWVALFTSTAAPGQEVSGVTIQDVSSELVGGFDRRAVYTVNGNGFEPNGTGTHSVVPDGNMWLNNGPNFPLPAVITFDLEGNYDLNSLTVWNYNETTNGLSTRGANEVEILVSDREGGTFTSLGNFNFTQAPGNDTTDFRQVIDLSGFPAADSTRLVRLNIISNHGGTDNYTGLSEVRFDGASVPGPLVIADLNPNQESSVAPDTNLVATFSKDIALKPGGTITLTDIDDGTSTLVITLPDARVTVSGADLIVDPSSDLEAANYEVVIDGNAVETTEVTPEAYAGTLSGQWTFSTITVVEGLAVKEVAGDGIIGSEVLVSNGGVATLPTQIGSNWRTDGGDGGDAPSAFSSLTSPTVVVPTTGPATLSFLHRYNFEVGFDGGAVFVSVNGAEPTYLAPSAFTRNGYVGAVQPTVWQNGEEVFQGKSSGYDLPTLVLSEADLGSLTAGDTISVEFRGGWDSLVFPAGTNWEIGTVMIKDSSNSALLDADFTADGASGFTAVTNAVNPSFPGGWEYAKVRYTFEIDADTLTGDRYAPDILGSVIDLNGADIVVELAGGTLEAGDEFVLFDLTGGTTLSGSIGSLALPPGLWDSSTLAVDGRLILLLPEETGGATAGSDFFMDASQDTDTQDGRSPDFAAGNPTGYDLVLGSGVTQESVSSTNFPRIRSAYDLPGGLIGDAGGIHMSSDPAGNNQRSFHEAPGDWTNNEDVSIEIWFKPDSLTPQDGANSNGQILFEDGGGIGLGIFLNSSGEIQARKMSGDGIVSYNIGTDPSGLLLDAATSEFIQVVATYDTTPGVLELFINGTRITPSGSDKADPGGNDWSGGDGAGIGTRGDVNVGGIGSGQQATESFDGQISIFRAYRNQLLTEAEVAANFTALTIPDTTQPTYSNLSPANLSTGVFFEDNLVATFTESIALTGAGSVTLRNLDTMSDTVISLPNGQVTVTSNQLTIDPLPVLAFDTNYAVLISSDAIVDEANTPNAFAGISDPTRWTFTTDAQDLVGPAIASLSPADDAAGVESLAPLIVTFDETLVIGTGSITLRNLTDGTEWIMDVTDSTQVSIAGNAITIAPTPALRSQSDYAVRIASGVVTDISGNASVGILDDTTWNFTTGNFQEVLFSDTFNRTDSVAQDGTDLNTSGAGKQGLLAPLEWRGQTTRTPSEGVLRILNEQLNIDIIGSADGNNGGVAWVDNNFTGLSELTVSIDIASTSSAGDGRNPGFGIGQSLAEISGLTNSSGPASVADVYVAWDQIGATRGVAIYHNGVLQQQPNPGGNAPLTMSASFTFADMETGTPINYEVFINGASVTTGTSAWSGTNENYISVQSNTSNPTAFDNFVVTGSLITGNTDDDYLAWSAGFPGADLSDPNGDFDNDGLSNDYERLFGLDPTSGSSIDPITVPFDRTLGTFSFTRRDDALTGMSTGIETSEDLVEWTVDSGAVLTAGTPNSKGVEIVDVVLSPDLLVADKLFVRVNQNDD